MPTPFPTVLRGPPSPSERPDLLPRDRIGWYREAYIGVGGPALPVASPKGNYTWEPSDDQVDTPPLYPSVEILVVPSTDPIVSKGESLTDAPGGVNSSDQQPSTSSEQ